MGNLQDSNNQMTTDNQQPITWADLTEWLKVSLKGLSEGYSVIPKTLQMLKTMGLAEQIGAKWDLTTEGRRVLASSQPDTGSGKPATISAAEFVANDYVGKIARGDCVVRDFMGDRVIDIRPYLLNDGYEIENHHEDNLNNEEDVWDLERDDKDWNKFTVQWLTVTPAAESPTAGEAWAILPFKLNKPRHLVVGQLVRRLEEYLSDRDIQVLFGKNGHAIIDAFVQQVEDHLEASLAAANEATAEAVRENGRLKMALGGVINHAREAQDDWAGAARLYAPEWTHPYKDIDDIAQEALAEALAPTDAANTNTGSE